MVKRPPRSGSKSGSGRWSQWDEIGWVHYPEIGWSHSDEIRWVQSPEILHIAECPVLPAARKRLPGALTEQISRKTCAVAR
jgi:hypothetical protein